MPYTIHRQAIEHSYSFGPSPGMRLLRPLLTSHSGFFFRRPFRHKARSPRVRTHSFTAQPPDLRHFTLTTRALRFHARSPCSAAPCIRFLYIGSQFRSTLPPHGRSPFRSCASLRSLWSARGGTFTHKSAPMPGAHDKSGLRARFLFGVATLIANHDIKPGRHEKSGQSPLFSSRCEKA